MWYLVLLLGGMALGAFGAWSYMRAEAKELEIETRKKETLLVLRISTLEAEQAGLVAALKVGGATNNEIENMLSNGFRVVDNDTDPSLH